GGQIANEAAFLPLRHGLLIYPVAPGKAPQALLTILYCSTDRLCRRGAAVKNLAHSASFHPWDKIAPSNAGTKQSGNCPESSAPRPRRPVSTRTKTQLRSLETWGASGGSLNAGTIRL